MLRRSFFLDQERNYVLDPSPRRVVDHYSPVVFEFERLGFSDRRALEFNTPTLPQNLHTSGPTHKLEHLEGLFERPGSLSSVKVIFSSHLFPLVFQVESRSRYLRFFVKLPEHLLPESAVLLYQPGQELLILGGPLASVVVGIEPPSAQVVTGLHTAVRKALGNLRPGSVQLLWYLLL